MFIWFHSLVENSDGLTQSLAEGLRGKGLDVGEYVRYATPAPGVLMISGVSEQVLRFVRDASFCGAARVLVIAKFPEAEGSSGGWDLLRAGASDVMAWDGAPELLEDVAARFERWNSVDEILKSPVVAENLIGKSLSWRHVLRQVVEIAKFTSASILVTGESGTGKELIARLVHTLDPRPRKGDLIVLDCTTVVPELSGSEFFGHERGAFTGAVSSREGAFALANNGTLFLDEVGELPSTLQAELLRVVQEHTFKRVGSNSWQRTEFRLVSATNKELRQDKNPGGFRSDLYYRLTSWTCHLPPLRERREDVEPLARHFVNQASKEGRPPRLSRDVLEHLMTRDYPGNIRELRQLVNRMVDRHTGQGPITVGDMPEEERPCSACGKQGWQDEQFERTVHRAVALGAKLKEISRATEDSAVRGAVAEEDGNWHRAALRLGVTDRALQLRRAAWRQKDGSTR
jgi:transcriptional regulator with GAF, ATPase, and Fis domain